MRACLLVVLALLTGCASSVGTPIGDPPAFVLGAFVDDYGLAYTVTDAEWVQRPGGRYHVVRWRPEAGYLVAQNDSANATDGGRWTRIDWVRLDGRTPYEWAFCLSVYDAPTAAAADSTRVARPETPRTGCNGYPFSRMRRASPRPSTAETPSGDS